MDGGIWYLVGSLLWYIFELITRNPPSFPSKTKCTCTHTTTPPTLQETETKTKQPQQQQTSATPPPPPPPPPRDQDKHKTAATATSARTYLVDHHLEDVPLPHHARARFGHRLGLLPLGCSSVGVVGWLGGWVVGWFV
jgi:type IV secretory pathway VirB10-like protein